mgnify:CR=1 FL=1
MAAGVDPQRTAADDGLKPVLNRVATGVIMGAALEAVYMGISGIGGVTAADYRSATAIAVGLTILSGITIEEGIALAAPIGALCLGLMNVTVAFSNIMEPLYLKTAKARVIA